MLCCWCSEAFLVEGGGGVVDSDGGWLKVERFGRGERLMLLRKLSGVVVVFAIFGRVKRIVVDFGGNVALLKARRVGS